MYRTPEQEALLYPSSLVAREVATRHHHDHRHHHAGAPTLASIASLGCHLHSARLFVGHELAGRGSASPRLGSARPGS